MEPYLAVPVNRNAIDITSKRFGKLLALFPCRRADDKSSVWLVQCDCGKQSFASSSNLIKNRVVSCGCYGKSANKTHGLTNSPTYRSWQHMKTRCSKKTGRWAYLYNGKGIRVCDQWLKFDGFLKDMGERPPGTSIDRINGNGNYEPGNCRWATPAEQSRNTRQNHFLTIEGETKCLADWGKPLNLSGACIYLRIYRLGWAPKDAVSKPAKKRKSK